MADIVFQTLKATRTGEGASTGKQTEVAFNDNFALVKRLLDELFAIAAITVTSEQITQIKADTTTNPYTLYYTTDPLDTANPTWIPLVVASFASLRGNPEDNIALKTILDQKGSASDVATLQTQMTGATTNIANLQTQQATNTQNIATNTTSIAGIRSEMLDVVHTQHGDTLYIRYVQNTNTLEYSIDGVTYTDINALGTSFSSITGSVTDNQTLTTYISTQITNALTTVAGTYATIQALQNHTTNINNPHNVTKAQVGLGNVENYSLHTMPIPDSVQQALNDIYQGTIPLVPITQADYRALPSPSPDSLYLTNSMF